MNNLKAKLANSKLLTSGPLGKLKDYIYYHYISGRMEAQTDRYRAAILQDLWEVFSGYNWILASGSFLRFYRDQTMDGQDLDIFMDFEDFQKVKSQLSKRGYHLLAEFVDGDQRVTEYKLKYKKADIDIVFIFHDEQGYYYIGSYEDPENKAAVIREAGQDQLVVHGEGYCAYRKNIHDFLSMEYEFQGMKFKGYQSVDEHLTGEYGNWHVYDPDFDFLRCPKENLPLKYSQAKVTYYYKPVKDY